MKAVQYFALLKYFPLAVHRLIPETNVHWKFMLHLSYLVDLIFAQRFTYDMTIHMKDVICDHLTMFVQLYSQYGVKLRPKHHLLVHLPSVVLKSGPLTGMSCMRYELKNSFFKRCAHVVCNFTNICRTIAYHHQQYALYAQLSNNHIRSCITVGKHRFEVAGSLQYFAALRDRFAISDTDEIAVSI